MPDFVTVNGVTIEYAWHGLPPVHAPTIVFLHEGLGSIAQWKTFPSVVCSRTGFGGLVYNRRGHGKSSPLVTSRDVDFMHEEAFDVLPRLLDVFEITHPILVGHSDGASIALIYAGSGAGEAASLVLESPHVFVEEVTVNRITALRDSYRTTDLRTKLSRHHGENTDMLFDTWIVEHRVVHRGGSMPDARAAGTTGRLRHRSPGECDHVATRRSMGGAAARSLRSFTSSRTAGSGRGHGYAIHQG
jgi:pimeloyl-ACP methyl ester carboxylesterase